MPKLRIPGWNSDWGVVKICEGFFEGSWFLVLDGRTVGRIMRTSVGKWIYERNGCAVFFKKLSDLLVYADENLKRFCGEKG